MPLLLEPFVHPDKILSNPGRERKENERWWAVYTRPRAEKAVARRLLARGESFFLPLYKHEYRCSGRKVKGYLPLFGGYLFLHGDDQSRIHALETKLVLSTIFIEDQVRLEADLAQLFRLMSCGLALAPEEKLPPGIAVQIISGPLAGIEGRILHHDKELRVCVEVQMLQRAVSIEVERWMIEPATRPPGGTGNGGDGPFCEN